MIGKGDRSKDLYVLNVDNLDMMSKEDYLPSRRSSAFVEKVLVQVWHHRLGHLSSQRFDLLKHQLNCDFSKCNSNDPCYICPLANKKR